MHPRVDDGPRHVPDGTRLRGDHGRGAALGNRVHALGRRQRQRRRRLHNVRMLVVATGVADYWIDVRQTTWMQGVDTYSDAGRRAMERVGIEHLLWRPGLTRMTKSGGLRGGDLEVIQHASLSSSNGKHTAL
jgi:hypothetical protein